MFVIMPYNESVTLYMGGCHFDMGVVYMKYYQSRIMTIDGVIKAEEAKRKEKERQTQKLFLDIQKEFTLENYLKQLTKQELDKIRQVMDIQGISSYKKDKLIIILAKSIKDSIYEILKAGAGLNELNYIIAVLSNDGVVEYDYRQSEQVIYLRSLGIVFTGTNENKNKVVVIPEELLGKIEVILSNKHFINQIEQKCKWAKVAFGFLHYYGVMEMSQLHKLTCNLLNENIDETEFILKLITYTKSDRRINNIGLTFFDLNVINPEYILEEQDKSNKIDYYKLTLDEVLKASEENNFIWNESDVNFCKFLISTLQLSEEYSTSLVNRCKYFINNGFKQIDIMKFYFKFIVFSSLKEVNNFTKCVQDVNDNCRTWILKGNTYKDMLKLRKF